MVARIAVRLLAVFVTQNALPTAAQTAADPIRYPVSFPEPHTHYLELTAGAGLCLTTHSHDFEGDFLAPPSVRQRASVMCDAARHPHLPCVIHECGVSQVSDSHTV